MIVMILTLINITLKSYKSTRGRSTRQNTFSTVQPYFTNYFYVRHGQNIDGQDTFYVPKTDGILMYLKIVKAITHTSRISNVIQLDSARNIVLDWAN